MLLQIIYCTRFACWEGGRNSSRGNFGKRIFHSTDQFLKGIPLGYAVSFRGILDLLALVRATSSIRLDGIACSRLSVHSKPIPRFLVGIDCRFRCVLVRVLFLANVSLSRSEIHPQCYIIVQIFVLINPRDVANAQIAPRRLIMFDLFLGRIIAIRFQCRVCITYSFFCLHSRFLHRSQARLLWKKDSN